MPRLTIPKDDIAVHEVALGPGLIYVVSWTDPINAFELVNHGGNPVWFTTDGRRPSIRGGHCRVALPFSSTWVNQVRRSPWSCCAIAENETTVSLIAS